MTILFLTYHQQGQLLTLKKDLILFIILRNKIAIEKKMKKKKLTGIHFEVHTIFSQRTLNRPSIDRHLSTTGNETKDLISLIKEVIIIFH